LRGFEGSEKREAGSGRREAGGGRRERRSGRVKAESAAAGPVGIPDLSFEFPLTLPPLPPPASAT